MKHFSTLSLMIISLSMSAAWGQRDPLTGEPKDQTRLALRIALEKVKDLPYYIVEPTTRIFKKSHQSLSQDFFDDPQIEVTHKNEAKSIFAYNLNYQSQKAMFSFADILHGKSYETKSCEDVCPKGLDILSVNRDQLLPRPEHFLSFRNIKPDFADSIKETIGYCWGHSTVLDDFHYLAFFDKDNKLGAVIPQSKIARINYYRSLIDQIVEEEKGTVIPGYANLRELAETEGLKEYLKVSVAKKWGKNAVKIRSIGNVKFDGKKMELSRTKTFLAEVEKRLISNQTPRILFAALGDSSWSHVLNIYGLSKEASGVTRLYVLETNYFPEDIPYQSHFIEIDQQGNATYAPLVLSRVGHNRIGKIKFTFEDKMSNAQYVRSLEKFCKKMTNCR